MNTITLYTRSGAYIGTAHVPAMVSGAPEVVVWRGTYYVPRYQYSTEYHETCVVMAVS